MMLTTENSIVTMERRDRLRIMAEMLEVAKNGVPKTRIMYRANLSYEQLNIYLKFLFDANMIMTLHQSNKVAYRTTEKGIGFLNRYCEMLQMFNEI